MNAYATNHADHARGSLLSRIDGLRISLRARLNRYRVYRRTLGELSALNDRELADLGLGRGELRRIAHQAAYDL